MITEKFTNYQVQQTGAGHSNIADTSLIGQLNGDFIQTGGNIFITVAIAPGNTPVNFPVTYTIQGKRADGTQASYLMKYYSGTIQKWKFKLVIP